MKEERSRVFVSFHAETPDAAQELINFCAAYGRSPVYRDEDENSNGPWVSWKVADADGAYQILLYRKDGEEAIEHVDRVLKEAGFLILKGFVQIYPHGARVEYIHRKGPLPEARVRYEGDAEEIADELGVDPAAVAARLPEGVRGAIITDMDGRGVVVSKRDTPPPSFPPGHCPKCGRLLVPTGSGNYRVCPNPDCTGHTESAAPAESSES